MVAGNAGADSRSGQGKHVWSLAGSAEALPFARHAAPSDDGAEPASTAALAARATGLETWGVLRGDVDNFGIRIRRAQTIEEHIQLSVMYKQFFAGELEVLCSMPEFWRKVTVIYSGGDDFAVYGAWDALIGLAREMERLFHRFAESESEGFRGTRRQDHQHGAGAGSGRGCVAGRGVRGSRAAAGSREIGG